MFFRCLFFFFDRVLIFVSFCGRGYRMVCGEGGRREDSGKVRRRRRGR